MKSVRATARVRVTVEIGPLGPWGPEVTAEQVYRQASKEAIELFRAATTKELRGGAAGIKVVGEPEVFMVTTEEER